MTEPRKRKLQRDLDRLLSSAQPVSVAGVTDHDLRTMAAGSLTKRVNSGGRWFTIYLDRLAVEVDHDNVHWMDTPIAGRVYEPDRPFRATGVLLARYQVVCDDDPTLQVWVQLSAPTVPGGQLRITDVTFHGDDLDSVSLPITKIRKACVYVGGVTGVWWTKGLELPDGKTVQSTHYTVTLGSNHVPFHPDELAELTGERQKRAPRGSRFAPETLRVVWDAIQEYELLNKQRKSAGLAPMSNKGKWIAQRAGQNANNIGVQIKAAREMYGSTSEGETK